MTHSHVLAWIKGELTSIEARTHSHPGSDNSDDHVHGGDPTEWNYGPGDQAYKPPTAEQQATTPLADSDAKKRIADLEADLAAALAARAPAAPPATTGPSPAPDGTTPGAAADPTQAPA